MCKNNGASKNENEKNKTGEGGVGIVCYLDFKNAECVLTFILLRGGMEEVQ